MINPERGLSDAHLMRNKYPAPGTNWFRDFFYPIYERYGGNRVLKNFLQLIVRLFPRRADRNRYARDMNMGEFVHFWSGAYQLSAS